MIIYKKILKSFAFLKKISIEMSPQDPYTETKNTKTVIRRLYFVSNFLSLLQSVERK